MTDLSLLDTLGLTSQGKAWLEIMPEECKQSLIGIDAVLRPLWKRGDCFPERDKVMKPMHLIAPGDVKLVIVCKEPYASSIATGVPVETDGGLSTDSAKIFKTAIQRYWLNVNESNFMRCYYASGIMVINASFTAQSSFDKRYALSNSHLPLWTNFCYPLIQCMNSAGMPILALGSEARSLCRHAKSSDIVHISTFPRGDHESTKEFLDKFSRLVEELIFIVS